MSAVGAHRAPGLDFFPQRRAPRLFQRRCAPRAALPSQRCAYPGFLRRTAARAPGHHRSRAVASGAADWCDSDDYEPSWLESCRSWDEDGLTLRTGSSHAEPSPTRRTQVRSAATGALLQRRGPWRQPVGRPRGASSVPRASGGAADGALAAKGDWDFEDDDDYRLFDLLELPEAQDQLAAETLGGKGIARGTISVLVATATRRTAEAVGTTAAGTASLLRDAGGKVGSVGARSPVGRAAARAHSSWEETTAGLPKGLWNRIKWLWDRPTFQRLRFTISMANLSVRLPAIIALVGTQIGLLATQVSLPMLAPLLLGTGMMFRSIKANASIIFPRIGLMVVLLWVLWFANSVIQNTVTYLRRQGAIDQRVAGAVINGSEICVLMAAVVILLSMLGMNLSGLLIPAGVTVAVAAKDLSHNFLAGFFLFAVQPFKLGDRVGVPHSSSGMSDGGQGAWFEGVCEKVDLRYTTIKRGRRRLLVPNATFLTREFTVMDEEGPVLDAGRQPAQHAARHRARAPRAASEWVRYSVLEGKPFHADQEELQHQHSAGGGRGTGPSECGANGGFGGDERHHDTRRQRQAAYFTDDEEPCFDG